MFNLKAPQSIFVHATGFHKATEALQAGGPGTPAFDPLCFCAMVTNSAFACELYLKCLIQMTTGQSYFKQHDLRKLFATLPDPIQAEIEKRFDAIEIPEYDLSNASKEVQEVAANRRNNFRTTLKDGAKAFESWRYMYEFEKDTDLNAYGLFPLPPILRAIILEREPMWAHFQIKLTKIGSRIPPTSRVQKMPAPGGEPSDPYDSSQ